MIKDNTKVKLHNDIIRVAKDLKPFQINMLVALNAEVNTEIAKVQKTSKLKKENVTYVILQSELKKDINYKGRINLIENLMDIQENTKLPYSMNTYLLDPEMKKNEIEILYKLNNIDEKEVGKFFDNGEFTTINFNTLLALKTKTEKILYLLMCQHKSTGLINYNLETLAETLGLGYIVRQNRSDAKRKILSALNKINELFEKSYHQKLTNSIGVKTTNTTNKISKMTIAYKGKLILKNVVKTNKTIEVYNDPKQLQRSLAKTDKQKIANLEDELKKMAQELAEAKKEINALKKENTKLKKENEKNKYEYDTSKMSTYEQMKAINDFRNKEDNNKNNDEYDNLPF